MLKFLFLDVEGVLNCTSRWKGPWAEHLDPYSCECLSKIFTETKCDIILSSTWRILKSQSISLQTHLEKHYGIPIGGDTPRTPDGFRCRQIRAWLEKVYLDETDRTQIYVQWLKDNTRIAIVDDGEDAGYGFAPHEFFKTDAKYGLTTDIANDIIQSLNRK
jgi:hypothetical protein